MTTLRAAERRDYSTFAQLFPELGVDDPIPDQETWWSRMGPTTLIAERGGETAGYLFYELIGETLYVRNVVSAPEARRTGIGRALMDAALAIGREKGMRKFCLNVKEDNAPAIRLYESLGLKTVFPTRVLRVRWDDALALPPADVDVRPPAPGEDAEIERELGLLAGMLERQRAIHRVVLAAFDRGGAPVGLASFNPEFPGSFPFRARDLGVTTALVRGLSAHRIPLDGDAWRKTHVQLVFENDEAQADRWEARGATRVVRILFMEGEFSSGSPVRSHQAGLRKAHP